MHSTLKSSRLLSTVLLALAGCHSPVTPPPGQPHCEEGTACSALLVNPCDDRVHTWDIIQFGSPQDDVGVALGSDDGCNVYVAGTTRGIIDNTDPTPPILQDVFVARVPAVQPDDSSPPSGDWLKRVVSAGDDIVRDLVVSGAGDAYVVGSTNGLMPGERELMEPLGFNDMFATKFGSDGTRQWMRQYGSMEDDTALATSLLRVEREGVQVEELLVAGASQMNYEQGYEMTLDRLSTSGQVLDRRMYGSAHHDRSEGVTVGPSGDIYLVGSTLGDFARTNAGSTDVALTRLSSDLKMEWLDQHATSDIDAALDAVHDGRGNLYVLAVSFSDLEWGQSENDGIQNSFLIKYNAETGQRLMVTRIGERSAYNRSTGMAVDAQGNVFVAGFTTGVLEDGKSNAGGRDAYVAMFDANGVKRWARQLGTVRNDEAQDVVITKTGEVIITGFTTGKLLDIDRDSARRDMDAFIARFPAPVLAP